MSIGKSRKITIKMVMCLKKYTHHLLKILIFINLLTADRVYDILTNLRME